MISPLLSPHSFFPFSSPLLLYPLFPISFLVSCMHYEYHYEKSPWKKSYDQPRQHIKKQRQVGGGIGMGNTCNSMANSC